MNTLRPYQLAGKADIFKTWELHDIIMFVLATGGGKTVTFVEVIREFLMLGKRVMLIAHRRELIEQSWQTLYRNKIRAGVIMGSKKTEFHLPCQVASIQTLANRKDLPPVDLYVIDEGHHFTDDNTYAKVCSANPNAKILIVTATPYRLSGQGFKNLLPGKETKLIINSTLQSLTDDGWLVPLKYYIAGTPDLTAIDIVKGNYEDESARKAMEMVPLVPSYLQHVPGKLGVIFGVNIKHSKDNIVPQYLQAGVPCVHMDADTPADIRDQAFADLRTGMIKAISNVGIITEGVDIPVLEFVQLANPTKSLSAHLQKVGRVTRAEAGLVDNYSTADLRRFAIEMSSKPYGYILDNCSAFVDHFLPYHPHNWEMYFEGWKAEKKPKAGILDDMLVFVAEDEQGGQKRSKNIKELEGMKLIEVTHEMVRKTVNLVALKKFDEMYSIMLRKADVKKPGYVAFSNYTKYCENQNILMIPEVWEYMRKKLITEPWTAYNNMLAMQEKFPESYPNPEEMKKKAEARRLREAVSRTQFEKWQQEYMKENADQMARYAVENIVNN